jgi:transcriptional regulator with XRE-family HTH domain
MASKTTFQVTPEKSSSSRRGRGTRKEEAHAPQGSQEEKMKLSKALGDAARAARLKAGLTQADVAERVGVATEVYGRLERGLLLPSVPTLRRLCLALHLAADTLLALDSSRPPAWTQASGYEREEPHIRRLLRHVRKLTPVQVRALSMVATTLRRDNTDASRTRRPQA